VLIIIKNEVTIFRLALRSPTLSLTSIKMSLWTFQFQGLNITKTVISPYSSMAMIYERFSWRDSWRRKLSKFPTRISNNFL